jgi:hypothetical protein
MKAPATKRKKPLAENARDPQPGITVDRNSIIDALRKTRGNISQAANILGCTRLTIHRAVESDPIIKEVREQGRESFVDELEESAEYEAINNPNAHVLKMFLLKTRARHRGYEQDDNKQHAQDIAKAAFDFVLNRTANPAES